MQDLILLHGAIGAKDQLGPLSETLSNRFRVHRMSFAGHGGKGMPEKFSIESFSEDVLLFMSRNRIERANIFGYSMGGYVALYLAATEPRRVRRVFTLATKFNWSPEIAAKEIKMLDADRIAEKVPAFAETLKERHKPNDWRDVLGKTAEMMTTLGDTPSLPGELLKAITQPVMICVGSRDKMVTLEESIAVYRGLPNAELLVIPGLEHPIEKIDLDRVEAEVKAFMLSEEPVNS